MLYAGFFLVGVVTVLLGPLIPELEVRWGVSHAQTAALFIAQFAASSVGSVLSSLHLRRSLLAGFGLIAAGLAGLAVSGWPQALVAMALTGLGLGLVIPATNLVVALDNPRRRGAVLSTLNLLWGLGAMACPLLFAALLGRVPLPAVLAALAALAGGALLYLAAAPGGRTIGEPAAAGAAEDEGGSGPEEPAGRLRSAGARAPRLAPLLTLAGMFFLYVGVENAIGGWLVSLSRQIDRAVEAGGGLRGGDVVSLLIDSGFWGALLAGRALAPAVLRRMSEAALYRLSLALAAAGALVLLFAASRGAAAAGAVAAGLGLAPLFPLTVSLLTERTAEAGVRRTGWVFACAGFGGAALPWLTGRLSTILGELRQGFWVPLVGLGLLAVLFTRERQDAARIRSAHAESV